jgi:hypothetical protein
MDTTRNLTRDSSASIITITCNRLACLQDARGLRLRVESGRVWITESGSSADVCLDAGESFTVTRDGLTVVTACRPQPFARICIEGSRTTAPALGARMSAWLRALLAPSAGPAMANR